MSVMSTELIPGPWTYADLESLPDDGKRYEIVDGVLLVNAAPAPRHQQVLARLFVVLDAAAPADLLVLPAPVDVVLTDDSVVEPDIVVALRSAYTETNLPTAPVLAVEVLSPSTRLVDLNLKKERYERAGIPSYWVLDPTTLVLTAYELVDSSYAEVAVVSPGGSWTARRPFEVTVEPGSLLR